jgi:hypothetical protein
MILGALFLITGTTGYHVCFWFITKICACIKINGTMQQVEMHI